MVEKEKTQETQTRSSLILKRRGRLRFLLPYIMFGGGMFMMASGIGIAVPNCSEITQTSESIIGTRAITSARSDVLGSIGVASAFVGSVLMIKGGTKLRG